MHGKKAFTLVQLLVVVMILGALAAIAIPQMLSAATDAKIRTCKTNVDMINSRIEAYYANKGAWPAALTTITCDPNYFLDGAPACPLGTGYMYNTTTHRVPNHLH